MKLEAIREDRTRGGRSTYQCSYTLPAGLCPPQSTSQLPLPVSASGPSSLPPGLPSVPLPEIKPEKEQRSLGEIPSLLQVNYLFI